MIIKYTSNDNFDNDNEIMTIIIITHDFCGYYRPHNNLVLISVHSMCSAICRETTNSRLLIAELY